MIQQEGLLGIVDFWILQHAMHEHFLGKGGGGLRKCHRVFLGERPQVLYQVTVPGMADLVSKGVGIMHRISVGHEYALLAGYH